MYEVAICEDEDFLLEDLRQLTQSILEELKVEHTITTFKDASSLLEVVSLNPIKFHLLLLEVGLKDKNGVDIAKRLRLEGNEESILFMAHSEEFAIEGHSVMPINYFVKPVERALLLEAIKKDYYERFSMQHIILPTNGGGKVLLINHILYVETINRIVIVHTIHERIECSMLLKEVEALLSGEIFARCHKSFIVNLKHVGTLARDKIELYNKREVPVGRAFYNNTLLKLVSFLEEY